MGWLPSSSSPLTRLSVGGVGPTGTKKRAETFSSSNYHEQGFFRFEQTNKMRKGAFYIYFLKLS